METFATGISFRRMLSLVEVGDWSNVCRCEQAFQGAESSKLNQVSTSSTTAKEL